MNQGLLHPGEESEEKQTRSLPSWSLKPRGGCRSKRKLQCEWAKYRKARKRPGEVERERKNMVHPGNPTVSVADSARGRVSG